MSIINIAESGSEFELLSPCVIDPIFDGSCLSSAQYVHSYRHWFEEDKVYYIQECPNFEEWVGIARQTSKTSWKDEDKTGTIENPNMYWRGIVNPLQKRAILERALKNPQFCQSTTHGHL